ncbi:MAG: hypothetical protein QGF32_06585, partial [Candidatus Thalassarchaeaceae archaeon]|nr:hypothetical protein [Candidatus Thalassarchaeaceae archaeon]
HGFRPAPTMMHDIDTTQYRNNRGQSFYDRWQENHGNVRMKGRTMKQAMKELIQSREYQQLPIESLEGNRSPRIDALDRIKRKYRAEAWKRTLQEFPEVARLNTKNQQVKANWRAGRPLSALLEY